MTRLTGRVDPKARGRYEAGVEVSATDFETYRKANLLTPFGMHSSGYVWTGSLAQQMARPYDGEGALLTPATDFDSTGRVFRKCRGRGYGEVYLNSWGVGVAHRAHGGDTTGFHSTAEVSLRSQSGFVILTKGAGGVELVKRLAPVVSRMARG